MLKHPVFRVFSKVNKLTLNTLNLFTNVGGFEKTDK